jgi:hypothetical protein
MQVQMRYRLAGSFPDVDPNVKSIGLMALTDGLFPLFNRLPNCLLFFWACLKPRCYVPLGHNQ